MGAIKVDINKKNRDAQWISLNNPDHVRELFRFYGRINNCIDEISEELLITYVSLFDLLKNINLNSKQSTIIKLYMQEYMENEIANELNINRSTVVGIIKSICNKIVQENHLRWLSGQYIHKFNMITKICSICGEKYPAIDEFYTNNNGILRKYCKKCENRRKKPTK